MDKKIDDSSDKEDDELETDDLSVDEYEKIKTNFDDSSDEEDDYKDQENLLQNQENFVQQNPNINKDVLEVIFTLEDQGRRVIYNHAAREKYYKEKQKVLSYDKKEIQTTLDKKEILKVLKISVNEAAEKLICGYTAFPAEIIESCFEKINERKLIAAILKQSNKEFLVAELENIFESLLEHLAKIRIEIDTTKGINPIDYSLTSSKLMQIEAIKNNICTKIKQALRSLYQYYQSTNKEGTLTNKAFDEKLKEFIGIAYHDLPKSIKENITENEAYKELHGNALNCFVEKILQKEIKQYLKDGFIDQPNNLDKSIFIKELITLSEKNGFFTIMKCKKSEFDKANINTTLSLRKTKHDFGLFLSSNLRKKLCINLQRKVLKINYNDSVPIDSVPDLYAKELLLYRSAIRQSRNNMKKEIARTVVFKEDQDLSIQKWQNIRPQEDADSEYVSNRGTLQEEVYNLGNYENVLAKIQGFNTTDKFMAEMIRAVYKNGIKCLDNITVGDLKTPLSQCLTKEQKQTLIELVELFFGTEAFRSPSTIVEINMALDLIIDSNASWKSLLTEKTSIGKGGNLSFSMKSTEDAGGIECGRRLSEDVNQNHSRMHKYGGKPINKDSLGYKEYLSRKSSIVYQWKKLQSNQELSLPKMIHNKDEVWYGIKLTI